VKSFNNSAKAFEFYRELVNNTIFFEKSGIEEYTQAVISSENFRILIKKKDDEEYLTFFRENYK
jgi:hypothetical protein